MPGRRFDPLYVHPDFLPTDADLQSQFIYFYRPGISDNDFTAVSICSTVTCDVFIFAVGREYWNETERYRLDRIYRNTDGIVYVDVTSGGVTQSMLIGLFLTKLIKSSYPVYAKSVIPWGM